MLGLASSLTLGWLALRHTEWSTLKAQLGGSSVEALLLAVALFLLASLVRAWRWALLFPSDRPTVVRLFVVQNEGIGVNNLLPFRLASEAVQISVLKLRDRIGGVDSMTSIVMERLVDLAATTLILGLAVLVLPVLRRFIPWLLAGALVVAAGLVAVRVLTAGGLFHSLLMRLGIVSLLSSALIRLISRPRTLFAAVVLSLVYWGLVGVTAWVVADTMALPISPVSATIAITGAIAFTSTVPGAPSGLGTFEFAVVEVLSLFGIDRSLGVGYAMIIHLVFFLPPILMALVFLPSEGIGAVWRPLRPVEPSAVGKDKPLI